MILNSLEVMVVSKNVEEAVRQKNFGYEVRRFWKGYNFGVYR